MINFLKKIYYAIVGKETIVEKWYGSMREELEPVKRRRGRPRKNVN